MNANFLAVRLHGLARDRRGVVAIEFAIISLVLGTLTLGAFDLGNAAQQQIQLQAAVRAGGAYAATYPTDPAGIQNAVTNALPTGWTLSSPPVVACSCLSSSTGSTSSTICTAPNCSTDAKIITIQAQMAYASLTGLLANQIAATYVVRYQ
jgi:hypothetical protein